MKRHWPIILVTTVFVVSNIIWIVLDQAPPLWDMAGHSVQAASLARGIFTNTIYPPASYAVTAMCFRLFGFYPDVPQYSLLFWVLLAAVSLYALVWKIYAQRQIAVVSTIIFFCIPLVAHFTRIYDLDFPLTAAVTATMCALVYSDYFTKRSWSILTGLAISLALLTKWTALIFLVAPIMLYIFYGWRNWKNILIAMALPLLLAAPWYIWHIQAILQSAHKTEQSSLLSNSQWFFYVEWLLRSLSWPVVLLLVLGLICAVLRRKRADWLLLVWFIGGILGMTLLFQTKDVRYILPIFPAVAILIAAVTSTIPIHADTPMARLYMFLTNSLIIFPCLVLWLQTSWNIPIISPAAIKFTHLTSTYGLQTITPKKPYYGFTYPTTTTVPLTQLAQAVEHTQAKTIIVVPNSLWLNGQQLNYYLLLDNYTNTDFSLSLQVRIGDWKKLLPQADAIITKTGDQGPLQWGPNLPDIPTKIPNYHEQLKLTWPTPEKDVPTVNLFTPIP